MTDCEARRLFAFINDFLDRERADAHLHMLVTFASDTGTVRTAPLDAHKKCLRLLKTWARAPHVLGAVSFRQQAADQMHFELSRFDTDSRTEDAGWRLLRGAAVNLMKWFAGRLTPAPEGVPVDPVPPAPPRALRMLRADGNVIEMLPQGEA
jgi:hypothetical protein